MSEKTHQPSEQRLREARKKGQIAKSKLFTSSAVTLGGLLMTIAFAHDAAHRVTEFTTRLFAQPATTRIDGVLLEALGVLAACVAPTLIGALVAALGSTVVVAGVQLNTDLVSPQLDRLNFVEGFKKLFSPRQFIEVGKGLLVALIISFILWNAVVDAAPLAFQLTGSDGAKALPALLSIWTPTVIKAAVVLLVLGIADQALAHRKHIKDLMMTHEEVKQEHKSSEGDPHHKAKRKSLHKQLANGGPARGVQKATAVVVNPTHIAVALRYDESECEAPYIVARARELDALHLRKHAETLGIPVIRDIPLARTLIHYDVGEQVPEELYQAAAAVLKAAFETSAGIDALTTARAR